MPDLASRGRGNDAVDHSAHFTDRITITPNIY
jgi:hypothetical protein